MTPYLQELHAAHVDRMARLSRGRPCDREEACAPVATIEPAIPVVAAAIPTPPQHDGPAPVTVRRIKAAVTKEFGLNAFRVRTRTRPYVIPRQIAMFLARKWTTRSLPEIGRFMGGYDHTTVLHGVGRGEKLAAEHADKVAAIEAALGVARAEVCP